MSINSLSEFKKHLNKTSNSDDTELQVHLEAATKVVEDYIGPVVQATKIERHENGKLLFLHEPPLISLTSVTPWHTAGSTSYDVADLDVDTEAGIVERKNGLAFSGGPFRVEYEAGRATFDANIKLAERIIAKHTWETQRGQMAKLPVGGGIDNVPVSTGISYAVPRRALELLRPNTDSVTFA